MDTYRSDIPFEIKAPFLPMGDQPAAIEALVEGLEGGLRYQTLLGVTGSGKTFTMAQVIARTGRPALVLAPNKTLAAQLAGELREFFPNNRVEYFVSYYDYYQPEAYVPSSDTYIEKDANINEEIDRLRHSATSSLLSRRDVIIVASVSCIYGLGSPREYLDQMIPLSAGEEYDMREVMRRLVDIQYDRNDYTLERGKFRLRGDTLEIHPAYEESALRLDFFGDELEKIMRIDPLTGEILETPKDTVIYPAKHFLADQDKLDTAVSAIRVELEERLAELEKMDKLVEAQRLKMRTEYDIEMLEELGFCNGIENYSRFLDGRSPGETPYTLLDYFPEDFIAILDESHIGVPQVNGMFGGDQSRKRNLVEYGFRLPSALDNRPLRFDEFLEKTGQMVFVSATPGAYENEHSDRTVEQLIRPTGVVDPEISVRPIENQIDDLIKEIRDRADKDERVLVTTLTKKMSEDLAEYLGEVGIKVRYLHSDVQTTERIELLTDLRAGVYDCLVGINLLREGLDLPEVSLVAILDADKAGFLRDERSLVQTIGRAARNIEGKVIMYADRMTDSMTRAIEETDRRRAIQVEYNEINNIKPASIQKAVKDILQVARSEKTANKAEQAQRKADEMAEMDLKALQATVQELEGEMFRAAAELDFEYAAKLRDQIEPLKTELETRRKGRRGLHAV